MAELIDVVKRVPIQEFIPVDEWIPQKEDILFDHARGSIILNIGPMYGMDSDSDINYFVMSPKRCYNSDTKVKEDGKISQGFREHCTHYLNYFEKFYDRQHWLYSIYARMKYIIDYQEGYYEENFINDLTRYIIDYQYAPLLHYALGRMNWDNYYIHLTYRNNRNPCLEYTDDHARILMEISMIQNMIIPLISHFGFKMKYITNDIDRLLIRCFDKIFTMIERKYSVDMIAKLLETTSSNVSKNEKNNSVIWGMQDIRGRNTTIHSMATIEQIIRQIIPKYSYNKNIIHFNFDAITRELKYKVTDIPFEFQLASVSSSIRDEDNNSESDKFEAHIAKFDESAMIQTNVNCDTTMRKIIQVYGPFPIEEIEFYERELTKDGKCIKNEFQSNLISHLFFKEFKDTRAAKLINNREYVILMIAAKRHLIREGQTLLPFIIGGRVERIVTKKIVNKKILQRIMISELYPKVVDKYRNDKINSENIFRNIAQILSSDFRNIDFYNDELNGLSIECIPEKICEEMLQYVLMI